MIILFAVLYLLVGVALVCFWRLEAADAIGDEFFNYDEAVISQIVSLTFAALLWWLVGFVRVYDWLQRRRDERSSSSQTSITVR